jgi:hypothetical protein
VLTLRPRLIRGSLAIKAKMGPNQGKASGCSSSDVSMLDDNSETTQESSPENGGVTEILSASAEAMEDAHKTTCAVSLEHCQDGAVHVPKPEVPAMKANLRSYQKEMLEQSLYRNVIVTVSKFASVDEPG